MEIAGPGAAGIDEGGGAAAPGQRRRVDAERGPAPIDMGVEVDEAWSDDVASRIPHDCARGRPKIGSDADNAAIGEGDIGDPVDPLARIDDAAAFEDEIGHSEGSFRQKELQKSLIRRTPPRGRDGRALRRARRRAPAGPEWRARRL